MQRHDFAPAVLRDYDIRGRVGGNLSTDDAHAVGRSFATVVRRAGGRRVAVGRDGRLSSPALAEALIAGLVAGGVDVVSIGIGPSPMLYFAASELEVDGGIQVTGSHNPGDDNGFKLVHQGAPFAGTKIHTLAALAAAGDWEEGAGDVTEADIGEAYVGRVLSGYAGGAFRIGWDAGSGAAGPAIEQLVKLLPGEHHLLFTEVDGNFPHHHPDPSVDGNLDALRRLVAEKSLDFGLAFDGDGDRLGAVDAHGRALTGDQILSILVQPALAEHPGAAIVADVKASDALFERITELGGRPVMWKTGHSNIKTMMKEVGAPLAGEMSGHLFFAELGGHDDALYAAVRLIRAVHLSGRSLAELRDDLPQRAHLAEQRIAVGEDRKQAIVAAVIDRLRSDGRELELIDGVRVASDDGWWLLRASNTEAALTVSAEASDDAALARVVADLDRQLADSEVRRG